MSGEPVRVLYIGGWGRSGSTLLDRILGQVPGFASLGEVREIWQHGVVENRPCGCGQPFRECSFWTKVGQEAFQGWDRLDVDEVVRLRYSVDRPWAAPVLLGGPGWRGARAAIERYREILAALYLAIRTVSGADVLIDSSKLPTHAMLLREIPQIDLRLVHLVRDSRGVAFSWKKVVEDRVIGDQRTYMEKYHPLSAGARYVLYNGLTGRLSRSGTPYLLLRYEDFVAHPREEIRRVVSHMGMSPSGELPFASAREIDLQPNHTVDGNPIRFHVGPLELRADVSWQQGMPSRDRAVVTALTYPLLRQYGYGRRAHAGAGAGNGRAG